MERIYDVHTHSITLAGKFLREKKIVEASSRKVIAICAHFLSTLEYTKKISSHSKFKLGFYIFTV